MCWLVFYLLYTSTWIIISLQLTSFCNLRTPFLISSKTVMFLIVKINKVVGAEKMVYCTTKSVLWCSKMCKIVFGRGSAPDPVGELTTLTQTPNRLGWGIPPPHFLPPSTPSASRSRRLWRLVIWASPAPHYHFNHCLKLWWLSGG